MLHCMIKIYDTPPAGVTEIVASRVNDAVDWPEIAFYPSRIRPQETPE
jgi:hypothetical protein